MHARSIYWLKCVATFFVVVFTFSGEKCIMVDKKWFSPGEFEKFGGKGHFKNWKQSIRCGSIPLQKPVKVCEELCSVLSMLRSVR